MNLPGGDKSLMFWQQVRGRVAPQGECATLFNALDWDDMRVSDNVKVVGVAPEEYVGCDLSLGGDKIPLYKFQVGLYDGRKVANKTDKKYITIDATKPDKSGQIAKQFRDIVALGWRIPLSRCSFDASGQQGAIVDTIERLIHTTTADRSYGYRVRTEEAVTERFLSNGRVKRDEKGGQRRETAKDRYKDRATEVLMNVVEMLQSSVVFGLDNDVKQQLCTRGYDEDSLDGGKCKAQKKKPWRDANGGRSPDELDAVAVFCTHVLEKKIIVPLAGIVKEDHQPKDIPAWMLQKPQQHVFRPRAAKVSVAMRKRF